MIFGINTTSDVSKLLYVISRAVRRVKFETILKYREWYLCQISRSNHASICSYYYWFVIFTCRYFKLSWNTTALSQSNCGNFSCSSIKEKTVGISGRHHWFPRELDGELKQRRRRQQLKRQKRNRFTGFHLGFIVWLRSPEWPDESRRLVFHVKLGIREF